MTERDIKEMLAARLEVEEGRSLMPYVDTVGKTSIGVGRNLTDRGIRKDEADLMLKNDIDEAYAECQHFIKWFDKSPARVRLVLADMSFNMGITTLMKFKKMLGHMERKKYMDAAAEMLDSKWARQVGQRAVELSEIIRTLS